MDDLIHSDECSKKQIVFLDTNSIDKNSFTPGIFGKRPALERVAKDYDFKIPRIVFDELHEHKRRKFEGEKQLLLRNALAKQMGIDLKTVEQLSFDCISREITTGETIPYEICEMEEPAIFLEKFYDLAVQHKPPFDAGSDKGFKDACVASAIEKYLNEHDNLDCVILVTADERLKEYFAKNPKVKTYGKGGFGSLCDKGLA